MKRLLGGFLVASLGLGLVAPAASAAEGPATTYHFTGTSGNAILTDCTPDLPAGSQCRAVAVNAFVERVNSKGQRIGGPGVSVTVYRVTISDGDPPFVAAVVASGFTTSATVTIAKNLSAARAAATVPLETCTFPDPEGGPVCTPAGSTAIDVQWSGYGPTSKYRFHDVYRDPFGFSNDRSSGSSRAAEATGTVDGAVFDDTPLFPPSLSTSKYGTVNRFAPLALSAIVPAALATAASTAHTQESSAAAAVSDCPADPPVSTTCAGVLVYAQSIEGRVGRQRVDEQSVFADVFALTFTQEGVYAQYLFSGWDFGAVVEIDSRLARAYAEAELATDLGPPFDLIPLTADWSGVGPTQPYRFHSQYKVDGSRGNTVGQGSVRAASTTGSFNGVPVTDFPGSSGSLQTLKLNSTSK